MYLESNQIRLAISVNYFRYVSLKEVKFAYLNTDKTNTSTLYLPLKRCHFSYFARVCAAKHSTFEFFRNK